MKRKYRRKRQIRRIKQMTFVAVFLVVILTGLTRVVPWLASKIGTDNTEKSEEFLSKQQELSAAVTGIATNQYPQELLDLLKNNEETYDFVKDYPKREEYKEAAIDLSGDYTAGEVPLLMQWDKRWGYNSYGDGIIGLNGCGPTCLTMAYIYLTKDTGKNPRTMADYAYENGYYTTDGTSWSLWTSGVSGLGLYGAELSLSEQLMKNHLDNSEVIVCSMAPGDFTTTGHFIVIWGYDKNGFYVNDPNHKSNSEKQWSYERLSWQIKCLWAIGM